MPDSLNPALECCSRASFLFLWPGFALRLDPLCDPALPAGIGLSPTKVDYTQWGRPCQGK